MFTVMLENSQLKYKMNILCFVSCSDKDREEPSLLSLHFRAESYI